VRIEYLKCGFVGNLADVGVVATKYVVDARSMCLFFLGFTPKFDDEIELCDP
jgi:hypothetical protein